jgi:hypothetical protein
MFSAKNSRADFPFSRGLNPDLPPQPRSAIPSRTTCSLQVSDEVGVWVGDIGVSLAEGFAGVCCQASNISEWLRAWRSLLNPRYLDSSDLFVA